MLNIMIIKQPVLLRIYYWMPDYTDILQEFNWQFMDVVPEYPRMNRFLGYWKNNIDATIHTVEIAHVTR